MARQNKKVVRYKRRIHVNISTILFLIILLYIVMISVHYFTQTKISIYEVVEKNISDDNSYRGIILRNETIYYTDKAGYVNYYIGDGERVAKGATVYTIDETGEIYKALSNEDTAIAPTKEDLAKIRESIAAFQEEYEPSNYSTVLQLKYDIENTLLEQSTSSMTSSLKSLVDSNDTGRFKMVNSKKTGVISYTMDGLEDLRRDDITSEYFTNYKDERVQLRSNESLAINSPVYKMINSEDWSIIIPLSNAQYDKLKDQETVPVTLKKDNVTVLASIEVYQKGDGYFAALQLNKYMIRYINDRYVDIEIKMNAAHGLKIPVSSILNKDFLVVPSDYIEVGGKTNTTGVTKETFDEKSGESMYEFLPVTVISADDDNSYIEGTDLAAGDSIINTKTNQSYLLAKKKSIEGVYNVNKGYAVFRVIEKLYENKEYAIVDENTPYGLSCYDHIVVNANSIKESDLIK